MSNFTEFELETGIDLDGKPQRQVVLKDELTAEDIFSAQEAAEVLKMTPHGGFELVTSHAILGREILGRSIKKIGTIDGPISIRMLNRLTQTDLRLIQDMVNANERLNDERAKKMVEAIDTLGKGGGQ